MAVDPLLASARGCDEEPRCEGRSTRELEKRTRAIEASKLRVPIAARYLLARAGDAHRRLAKCHAFGKVVPRVR
ncbi:MAG: zinc-binding dehydrogenase [Planctomycetia bacterium]|nr:zinc-binding dehydrogenase [Planctomycetia bacterium]